MITDTSSTTSDFLHFQKAVVKPDLYTKTGMVSILKRLQNKYSVKFPEFNGSEFKTGALKEMLNFFYYKVVIKNENKN